MRRKKELWRDKSWLLHHNDAPIYNALSILKFLLKITLPGLNELSIHQILLHVTFFFSSSSRRSSKGLIWKGLPPATWLHQGITTLFSTSRYTFKVDFEDVRWHDVALTWNHIKDHNRSRKLCFHHPGRVPVICDNPVMVLAVVHLVLAEVIFVWKEPVHVWFLGMLQFVEQPGGLD